MTQPNLFDESVKLRHDARETSVLAAKNMKPKSGTARFKVWMAFLTYKEGLMDDELVSLLQMSPNTVRPRRVELVEAGYIKDSGRRRHNAHGNACVVWIATDKT